MNFNIEAQGDPRAATTPQKQQGAEVRMKTMSGVRQRLAGLYELASTSWEFLSLARQFGVVASVVVLFGMTVIGGWVTEKIARSVTNNSAIAATLYMDAFVAPLVQDLKHSDRLSAEHRAKLDELMNHQDIRENVVSIKVWQKRAVVAYSNFSDIIGKSFKPTSHLKQAWTGTVSADLDGHSHDDDVHESEHDEPLLEIYAPIREAGSNRIIAVSEFYVRAEQLLEDLRVARLQSWGVVAACGLAMIALLYMIVLRGSRTIEHQQRALQLRAAQNATLHKKIEKAYWRADRLNEQYLRQLGADLHDGPAQLIGYALMNIDDLPLDRARLDDPSEQGAEPLRKALEAALLDIRNLSRGLMLPELEKLSLNEAIRLIVRAHEERTATKVEIDLPAEQVATQQEVKICVSRFIQEALSNAFKHAGGLGQRVELSCKDDILTVKVADKGSGLQQQPQDRNGANQLGLVGIRDRVETLSGSFALTTPPQGGTVVSISLSCWPSNKTV